MHITKRATWAAGLAIFAAVSVAISFATLQKASAWQPTVSGKVSCDGRVDFAARSFNQGVAGNNSSVGVFYSVDSGKTYQPVVPASASSTPVSQGGIRYEFSKANGNRFDDSFTLSSRPKSVFLKVVPLAKWATDDDQLHAGATNAKTIELQVPPPCAKPSATISGPTCQTGKAVVYLRNDGGQSIGFTVVRDAESEPVSSVALGAGSSEKVEVLLARPVKLTVNAAEKVVSQQTVAPVPDCIKPIVSAKAQCSAKASGVTVRLQNAGKVPQQFVVKAGSKTVDTVRLEAGQTSEKMQAFRSVAPKSGDKFHLTVSADGKETFGTDVTNDCYGGEVKLATDCKQGGIVVRFSNSGKLPESYTVTRDGRSLEGSPLSVQPGATSVKLLPMAAGDSAALHIVANGSGKVSDQLVKYGCAVPLAQNSTTTTATPQLKDVDIKGDRLESTEVSQLAVEDSDVPASSRSLVAPFGAAVLLFGLATFALSIKRRSSRSV